MQAIYSLYKREDTGYWWYSYHDKSGKRVRKSTKCKSKAKAQKVLDEVKEEHLKISCPNHTTFREYYASWFTKDCPYYQESKLNGKILSDNYMITARYSLKNHLMPYFGSMRLCQITTGKIEEWKLGLLKEGKVSNKSVHSYLSLLSVMLKYAWRYEVIDTKPYERVRRPIKNCKARGVLTAKEAKKLFSQDWNSDTAFYANKIASITGMRAGEIRALRKCDIKSDHIVVAHSWVTRTKTLKGTKSDKVRIVPIPRTLAAILKLRAKLETDFIFASVNNENEPIEEKNFLEHLRRELVKSGISLEQQKKRNICFHSWRHFLNSQLRASGVSDLVTKKITGHATDEMMELYTHIPQEAMYEICEIQERLLGSY